MDRLIDKLVMGIGCVIVVATGEPNAYAVVGILCAIVASGLFEWLPAPWRAIPLDAYLAACPLWPELLPLVPLMAYDAARSMPQKGEPLALPGALALGLCGIALVVTALRLPLAPALFVWLFAALAFLLSQRTSRGLIQNRTQREARDALRERSFALEAKNRDLRERQDFEVELATLAERGRIARDIHDSVGHLLTRASLQVEALRVAHEDDGVLDGQLAGVQATVDEALDAVRASVHALHEGTFDLADKLRSIVGDFEAQSGMSVALTCDFGDVAAPVALAIVAVVREALANVARHSQASTVSVRVVEYPALYQLTVKDNGEARSLRAAPNAPEQRASASASEPSGLGLASMEERVLALGGHFSAGPMLKRAGWRVFCSLPKEVTR